MGDRLSTGDISAHDVLKYKGMKDTQRFLVDEIDRINDHKLDQRDIEVRPFQRGRILGRFLARIAILFSGVGAVEDVLLRNQTVVAKSVFPGDSTFGRSFCWDSTLLEW